MIVVLTTPREGVCYLTETLASIDESVSVQRKIVLADTSDESFSPPLPIGWELIRYQKPPRQGRANKWSTWKAFELAASAQEDLLFFEDDVRLVKHGTWFIERLKVPDDVAFLSIFNPHCPTSMPKGIWRGRMDGFTYCQALKVPLRTCIALTEGRSEMASNLPRGASDDCLRDFGTSRSWTYGLVHPSVVQHIGEVSSIGTQDLTGRTAPSYLGDGFDARALHLRSFY